MATRKWRHQALLTIIKGKLRVQCSCGKQSPLFADIFHDYTITKEEQADQWWVNHTGLQEISATRKEE